MKVIKTIYLYLVSFISLIVLIFATVAAVDAIMNVIYPNDYNYYSVDYYEKDKSMKLMELEERREEISTEEFTKSIEQIKNEYSEITKNEETRREVEMENQRRNNIKSVANSIVTIIIIFPIYLFHFKKAIKEEA